MSASIQYDIKVSMNDEGKIVVDMLAHRMQTNEDEPDRMTVNYAACLTMIKNPSMEWIDKMNTLLETIITKTLSGWKGPNIGAEKQQMIEQGKTSMLALLSQ